MALTKITSTNIEAGGVSLDNLADSGVTAGTHGNSSGIPVITVNSKGIITGVEVVTVAGVSDFTYNSSTEVLTISTADGSTFNADISTLASQTYVDTAESDAVTTANAYTDTRESAITTAYENYTDTAVSNLVDTAPAALDTLNELAAALGDDANFATTVSTNLGNKVDKINITGATVGTSTAIPVITFNAQGQITSASTTPITVGDGTLTVNSGTGLSGSGTFTANQTSNGTITLSHADTSSQASVNNSGANVIQDVTLDGFGHVTGLGSVDLSTQFLGINAKAADSDLLDGLNSTQFLRSDAADTMSGVLTVNGGTTDYGLVVQSSDNRAGIKLIDNDTTGVIFAESGVVQVGLTTSLSSNNLTIDSSGNVGIGTTSPSSKLHVEDGDLILGNWGTYPGDGGASSTGTGTSGKLKFALTFNSSSYDPAIELFRRADWSSSIGIMSDQFTFASGHSFDFRTLATDSNPHGNRVLNIHDDGRLEVISTDQKALDIIVNNAGSAYIKLNNTNASSLYTYLQLGTSSEGNGYLIKNNASNGNGLNNGSLYLWNAGGSAGKDRIEFVPNADITKRVTIEENGNLITRGNLEVNGDYIALPTGSSDPSGAAGRIYYNTNSNVIRFHNGSSWRNITEETDATSDDAFFRTGFNSNFDNSGIGAQTMSGSGSYSFTGSSKIGTAALDFGTAQTGYADVGSCPNTNNWSTGGWFYIYRSNTNIRSYIVDFRTGNSSNSYWLFDNLSQMAIKMTNAETVFSYTVPTNSWVHWVVVSDVSGGTTKFYVNGSLYHTGGNYGSTMNGTATLGTYFGVRGGSGQYFMNGRVDNFFLTETAYSASQVQEIYNSTVDY